ncbi:MAG: stage III sporulation protein AA [Alkaliphilus sp.]|nr:MAG: stage III sporulation protein AA [Alkaliphilus sp.]
MKIEKNDKHMGKNNNIEVVNQLENYLCPEIRKLIKLIPDNIKETIEEIRLRVNKPLMILGNNEDYYVNCNGVLSTKLDRSFYVSQKNIDTTLQFVSNYSIYAIEEELKRGYITITGGHRVGVVGKTIFDLHGIRTIKYVNGLNIRVSREKRGVAKVVIKYLVDRKGYFLNTLIVSPPQCGKTTLLRDIIRSISNGNEKNGIKGAKVGVVDERSEIAGCFQGIPQNDLGIRTDILDCCRKADGIMMLIRSMSPQVIATDEVGKEDDYLAIEEALTAGIKLISTVHGKTIEDVYSKKVIGKLVKNKVFERIIVLSNRFEVGTIEAIYDGENLRNLIDKAIRNKLVV